MLKKIKITDIITKILHTLKNLKKTKMGGGGIGPPRQAFQAYTLPLSYPPRLTCTLKLNFTNHNDG